MSERDAIAYAKRLRVPTQGFRRVRHQRIGHYEVLAVLGKGGSGEVSLAVSRSDDFRKLVVLKTLRQEFEEDPDSIESFMDEARLAAHLHHPNIVQTFEVGVAHPSHFIAMDYLEGIPLNRLLSRLGRRERSVDPGVAALIAREVLAGLHYAHKLESYDGTPLSIVHRDVSPSNIFVSWDGVVRLIDFGIAKAAMRRTNTDSGVIKGKFAYIAPEQVTGGHVDQQADIYSLGVVLWEMLAGKRLRPHDNDVVTLQALVQGETPSIQEENSEVDDVLAAIVARALRMDASERYESANAMAEALDDWLAQRTTQIVKEDVAALIGDTFEGERVQQELLVRECMQGISKSDETSNGELAPLPLARMDEGRSPIPRLPVALIACGFLVVLWLLVGF
ncbi:MAG: serine/threonine protein kinase [Polyangiales bacterium]